MRTIFILSVFIILSSCVPIKIAPAIEDYKIVSAKKFKKKLPDRTAFIFEDPKKANEFYSYINIKYQMNNNEVGWNVPFTLNNKKYYFSFYDAERSTQVVNLVAMAIDSGLEQNDRDPALEELYYPRTGYWYLVVTVNDEELNDCLSDDYKNRKAIIAYLSELKTEYLNTTNYNSLLFKK